MKTAILLILMLTVTCAHADPVIDYVYEGGQFKKRIQSTVVKEGKPRADIQATLARQIAYRGRLVAIQNKALTNKQAREVGNLCGMTSLSKIKNYNEILTKRIAALTAQIVQMKKVLKDNP
jgi:hypothetical protein